MSDQLQLKISRDTLIDHLRKLHSDLSDEKRHTEALLLDLAIQAITTEAEQVVIEAAEGCHAAFHHGLTSHDKSAAEFLIAAVDRLFESRKNSRTDPH